LIKTIKYLTYLINHIIQLILILLSTFTSEKYFSTIKIMKNKHKDEFLIDSLIIYIQKNIEKFDKNKF